MKSPDYELKEDKWEEFINLTCAGFWQTGKSKIKLSPGKAFRQLLKRRNEVVLDG